MSRLYNIDKPIKLATLFGIRLKDYTLKMFIVSIVYSPPLLIYDSHWDDAILILRSVKGTPSQEMYESGGHTWIVGYSDIDWADSLTDRCSTLGYCVSIEGNLISWKSKKQDVVAKSSGEAEYWVMTLATCELIWLRHLLQVIRFGNNEQMKLIYDYQETLHFASKPVF